MASRKRNENGLTECHQKFANEYLMDPKRNATQAAIRAGYSPKTAKQTASEILTRPDVSEFIKRKDTEITKAAMDKFGITTERIIQELACIGFFDPGELFDSDGMIIPLQDMPEHVARALTAGFVGVQEIKLDRDGKQIGLCAVIKLRFPKLNALELLGKHLKMW